METGEQCNKNNLLKPLKAPSGVLPLTFLGPVCWALTNAQGSCVGSGAPGESPGERSRGCRRRGPKELTGPETGKTEWGKENGMSCILFSCPEPQRPFFANPAHNCVSDPGKKQRTMFRNGAKETSAPALRERPAASSTTGLVQRALVVELRRENGVQLHRQGVRGLPRLVQSLRCASGVLSTYWTGVRKHLCSGMRLSPPYTTCARVSTHTPPSRFM